MQANGLEDYKGKTFVIKYGGSIMQSNEGKIGFIEDICHLISAGIKVVIVHGGGQFISSRLEAMGIETCFESGYRVTDKRAIKEVEMLLSGGINTALTLEFNRRGIRAVGLSGKDGGVIEARKKQVIKDQQVIDMGCVGEIDLIEDAYINLLLNQGYLPIVSPIAYDQQGMTYNLNADDVAGQLSGAIQAEKLILMTDVKGLYKNLDDEKTFIEKLKKQEAKDLIDQGIIKGGMIPKLKSCIQALENGSKSAHIISGIKTHSLLETIKVGGIGTRVE